MTKGPNRGLNSSKWHSPYTERAHGKDRALELYHDRIFKGIDEKGVMNTLYQELYELDNMILGCWCDDLCHGHTLLGLRRYQGTMNELIAPEFLESERLEIVAALALAETEEQAPSFVAAGEEDTNVSATFVYEEIAKGIRCRPSTDQSGKE